MISYLPAFFFYSAKRMTEHRVKYVLVKGRQPFFYQIVIYGTRTVFSLNRTSSERRINNSFVYL